MIKSFSGFAIWADACALELRAMTGCGEDEAVAFVRETATRNPGRLVEVWASHIKPAVYLTGSIPGSAHGSQG